MSENVVEMSQNSEFEVKSIVPLFVKYAGLALVGLLAQGIMVFLEGIIIGNSLGTYGFTIIGILMPLEYFQLALHGCFGIGISTVASMRLGNGDTEGARKCYAQGMWAAIYLIAIITITIEVFASHVATLVGCPAELNQVATLTLRIFVAWWPFSMIGQICGYMVRVDEKPKIGSFVVTLAAVLSSVWLFLSCFVFKFGSPGAGVYYGFSIGLFSLMFLYFLFSKKTIFKMHMSDMKLDFKELKEILKIGFPYLFVQISATVFGIVINNLFVQNGDELGIAIYAVISGYVLYILMMIMQACTQGVLPIASYNLGSKLIGRVKSSLTVSIIGNLIAVYILGAIFIIFVRPIYGVLCGGDAALADACVKYNTMMCLVAGLGLTADFLSGYFQAVGRVGVSTILAMARYIIFSVPFMYILSNVMGTEGIWYGQVIGYILAFVLAIIFLLNEFRRLKKIEK